jgi:hypothetical protein
VILEGATEPFRVTLRGRVRNGSPRRLLYRRVKEGRLELAGIVGFMIGGRTRCEKPNGHRESDEDHPADQDNR